MAISWHACSGVHICWLTCLECTYIYGCQLAHLQWGAYMLADTLGVSIYYMALAGMLAVGVHICWLTHLERAYIIWL